MAQVLEVILDKLVLDQVKEYQNQKRELKDTNNKNYIERIHLKKRLNVVNECIYITSKLNMKL